jgi:transmembrane sensor
LAKDSKAVMVNSSVDLTQALAWKNGLFNFNGSDLRSVMRQLERWYDIKVQFEGPVPNDVFRGEMYRNVNLSDVLDMLREMDVKFRMEGKTLIVAG